MSQSGPTDSIREFAGDAAGAVALRDGISQLAQHYAGTPLGDQLAAVLAGRTTMRELAGDPEFVAMTTRFTQEFSDEWDALDPRERADLVGRGQALLTELEPRSDADGSPTGPAEVEPPLRR